MFVICIDDYWQAAEIASNIFFTGIEEQKLLNDNSWTKNAEQQLDEQQLLNDNYWTAIVEQQ